MPSSQFSSLKHLNVFLPVYVTCSSLLHFHEPIEALASSVSHPRPTLSTNLYLAGEERGLKAHCEISFHCEWLDYHLFPGIHTEMLTWMEKWHKSETCKWFDHEGGGVTWSVFLGPFWCCKLVFWFFYKFVRISVVYLCDTHTHLSFFALSINQFWVIRIFHWMWHAYSHSVGTNAV